MSPAGTCAYWHLCSGIGRERNLTVKCCGFISWDMVWEECGVEGLRTDQLKLPGTGLAVSQLLSAALVGAAVGILHYKHSKLKKQKNI